MGQFVANIRNGEHYDVYVGRPSEWGNPFVIGSDGSRDDVIDKFKAYLWKRMRNEPELENKLLALDGKVLGCYCAPQPCHADVLVRSVEWIKEKNS